MTTSESVETATNPMPRHRAKLSNPPNAKEKQGEPYTEEAAPAAKPASDSSAAAPGDSTMVTKAAQ